MQQAHVLQSWRLIQRTSVLIKIGIHQLLYVLSTNF